MKKMKHERDERSINERDGSCRDENVKICYGSDKKRQDSKPVHQKYLQRRMVRIKNEEGQAEVVWTCHEERPRVCRKKDDRNGVTGKEEKRKTKEKIFKFSERRYGEVCAEMDVEDRTV